MALKKLNIVIIVILSLVVLSLLILLTVNLIVVNSSSDKVLTQDSITGQYDAIVVLGAGIQANKTPSNMLADRLDVAIQLYEGGVSEYIVLSGDCSGEDYDEVSVMFNYCANRGIPESSLIRDNSGYSTYESVYNVTKRLGYKSFVIVTQKYHLSRTIYIATQMDAEVIGVASDLRAYNIINHIYRSLREYAARLKDFIKVEISQ